MCRTAHKEVMSSFKITAVMLLAACMLFVHVPALEPYLEGCFSTSVNIENLGGERSA